MKKITFLMIAFLTSFLMVKAQKNDDGYTMGGDRKIKFTNYADLY